MKIFKSHKIAFFNFKNFKYFFKILCVWFNCLQKTLDIVCTI